MIKLGDGNLLDCFPKKTPEIVALSYALQCAIKLIIKCADESRVYCAIDQLSEKILDVLAVEMRSFYYDENLSIEKKREIIKNTMQWHSEAGTPAAVEGLIKTIFGSGQIEEWFNYNGAPGYFRIYVNNVEKIEYGKNREFKEMLKKIKRLSAHMEEIYYTFDYATQQKINLNMLFRETIECYPRYNIPFLRYDGTAQYNGTVRYDKYKTNERIQLYPIQLGIRFDNRHRIFFCPQIMFKNLFMVPVHFESKIGCRNEINTPPKMESKLVITKENTILPKYQIRLKIGKHPNRYDGKCRYDGKSQYYVKKEEIL